MATKKKKTSKKIIKPIKEVITSNTKIEQSEPNFLKLKDNKDIDILKKYQKELELDHFEMTDGRIM